MGSTPGCRQLGADVAGIHSPEQVKERGAKAEGSLVLGGGGGGVNGIKVQGLLSLFS